MTAPRWDLRACRNQPEAWFAFDTYTRAHAIHQCLRHCPVYELCAATTPPTRGAIVAGVLYTDKDQYRRHDLQPRPSSKGCTTCWPKAAPVAAKPKAPRKPPSRLDNCGTVRGYRRHIRLGEDACEPCLLANRRRGQEQRANDAERRIA